jgi:hypothetical protein
MAVTITPYTSYNQYIHSGEMNLNDTGKIKLALVTSTYVFSAAHTIFDNGADDATDPSFCEVVTGDGYTTGGAVLASLSVTAVRFDATDITFTALTKTFRGGVLYQDATYLTIVKPLIAYILFDSTPADTTVGGGDFTIQWHANGIITF